MGSPPTIDRPLKKSYSCNKCGKEFKLLSNHWGPASYSPCCGNVGGACLTQYTPDQPQKDKKRGLSAKS